MMKIEVVQVQRLDLVQNFLGMSRVRQRVLCPSKSNLPDHVLEFASEWNKISVRGPLRLSGSIEILNIPVPF